MERAEYSNRNGGRVLGSVSIQSHYLGPPGNGPTLLFSTLKPLYIATPIFYLVERDFHPFKYIIVFYYKYLFIVIV